MKQYKPYLTKWKEYCSEWETDPSLVSVTDGINFLAHLFDTGIGYSAINTARSALSTSFPAHNRIPFGCDPTDTRLLKGIFNKRRALPKYTTTWDANIVLCICHLKTITLNGITIKLLTMKLAMLMALLTAKMI